MMKHPLVTVIIPVYNSEKYIRKSVESVLKQTYANLQVVIVDDGSVDRSQEICRSIQDERIEIYSKANGGASSARNVGLQHRKGKYVLFVDSDDELKETAVEKLVSTAEKTSADCVYYEADNISAESNIKIKKDGLRQAIQYSVSDGNTLIEALLQNKNYHAVPFLYFANSALYDKGLRFEEGIMFEDEIFSFELLRMCQSVVPLKEVLYFRNVRSDSVMTSKGKEEFRFHSITVVFGKLYAQYAVGQDDNVLDQYLARIAMLWLDYYRQLSSASKRKVADKYDEMKTIVLENNGFNNKELMIRCRGEKLWLLYIAPNRITKRIKRKLKHG